MWKLFKNGIKVSSLPSSGRLQGRKSPSPPNGEVLQPNYKVKVIKLFQKMDLGSSTFLISLDLIDKENRNAESWAPLLLVAAHTLALNEVTSVIWQCLYSRLQWLLFCSRKEWDPSLFMSMVRTHAKQLNQRHLAETTRLLRPAALCVLGPFTL